MAQTIVMAANAAWNLSNFRSGLIAALIAKGYRVVAAAPPDPQAEAALRELGCEFAPVPVDSKGLSVLRDFATLRAFRRLLRRERPCCFVSYTIKPNIYGAMAARGLGIPAVLNISGLGTAFIRRTWLTGVVEGLYRVALRGAQTVFFQNDTDRGLFVEKRLARPAQAALLPGSGIDLARFTPTPRPAAEGRPAVFLLIARLVRDKGVLEYVEAARRLRAEGVAARCQILGFLDVDNRTAVSRGEVDRWVADADVEYLGAADDVRPHIAAADCVVLPSYREGTSRVLLEAAAMATPIVTTDVPGCREVVDKDVSGLLCAPADAGSLAAAMKRFAGFDTDGRRAMGIAGRDKVEREFDERIVIGRYLDAIAAACAAGDTH